MLDFTLQWPVSPQYSTQSFVFVTSMHISIFVKSSLISLHPTANTVQHLDKIWHDVSHRAGNKFNQMSRKWTSTEIKQSAKLILHANSTVVPRVSAAQFPAVSLIWNLRGKMEQSIQQTITKNQDAGDNCIFGLTSFFANWLNACFEALYRRKTSKTFFRVVQKCDFITM